MISQRCKRYSYCLNVVLLSLYIVICTGPLNAAAPPVYERIQAISENINSPSSIAIDANGWIYVAESSRNTLNIYSAGGYFIKQVKGLANPFSVALDSQQRILVGNGRTSNVEVYDYDFNLLFKLGAGDGEVLKPCAITVDSTGLIYVADCEDDKVKVYNSDYSFNFSFGSSGNGAGYFNQPSSIAVDENTGEIMVVDTRYASGMMGAYQAPRVQVFDMNGVYKRVFGRRGVSIGRIFRPSGITIDSQSRVYVSDSYQNVVQVFDNAFSSLGVIYDLNNPVSTPLGIALSETGKLYVASHHARKVEVYGIDNYLHMSLSPVSLQFQANQGSSNPSDKIVTITNSGKEAFSWNAVSADSWIVLGNSSGSLDMGNASDLVVGIDISGLTAGTYSGSVDIISDAGMAEHINVTLAITLSPDLSVSPASLYFESVNGSIPHSQTLTIENSGQGVLDWTASGGGPWLSLSKSAGTAPDSIAVSVDPSWLNEGVYSDSISVTGAGATGSPAVVPVTLSVVSMTGTIEVITNNNEATFSINGPASYNGSGISWNMVDAPVGTYTIIYGDVQDHITPEAESLTLMDDGSITFNGIYELETGVLNVTTNHEEATFTINGPVSYNGSGTSWTITDAPVGSYDITFGNIPGFHQPATQTDVLIKDQTITFNGQYDIRYKNIIAGAGHDDTNTGLVKVFTHAGADTGLSFNAHSFMFGVNVASGDIDGDGTDEIITAPGPGPDSPAEIRVFDSNGVEVQGLTTNAFAYFYGANVASADFNGDGYAEVITGAGAGSTNPAALKVYTYDSASQTLIESGVDMEAYSSNYGVHVAAGDMDGDGIPELITSPGPSSKNLGIVKIWQIDTSAGVGQWSASLVHEFTVAAEYKYSVTITSSDVNGDGFDEIITGDGPHSKAKDVVRVYDQNGTMLNVWQAGTAFGGYGANVASGDLDNNDISEILVAPGPGSDNAAYIKVLDSAGNQITGFTPFNMSSGANIAVGDLGREEAQ